MELRRRELFTTIRTEGAILPADLLQRVAGGDSDLGGLKPTDYHLFEGEPLNEAIVRSWNRLVGAWAAFSEARARLPEGDLGTTITRERWLLILFDELDYGRLQAARALEIDGKSYAASHSWGEHVPLHLVGCNVSLDRRSQGVAGAAAMSPHGLVQELLNRSEDRLWGFVSNGLALRVLRDNSSLTRQAYLEFDLASMMDGEVYADFVVLWLVCHQSRVEGDTPYECWLERWSQEAVKQGTRALDGLRNGVEAAIAALGGGFLTHPANTVLRDELRSGALDKQDYYRELLRLVYRLLFLFVAEDRGLLLSPDATPEAATRYATYYSTQRLRRLAERRRGSKHGDVYQGLRLVMNKLGEDDGCPALGLPALGSYLWSGEAVPNLGSAELANSALLEAVRALATLDERGVRRSVDYRNLGAEELGSVYESLLELHPELNVDAGRFELTTAAGNERKTTGSYYTPTSLISCLLDSALDPVLDEAATKGAGGILALKVCDPACGSGHFLVAAAHRIAKRLASARTGDDEPSPEATRSALRDVVGHCLYGVDVNPMAVELCKVSLWMEALDPGKPLSFLDAHVKCGNSLLGTTPELLAAGIPDAAFKSVEGDEPKIVSELRKRNRHERDGQLTIQEEVAELESLAAQAAEVEAVLDDSVAAVHVKETRFRQFVTSAGYRQAKLLADAWCASFVIPKTSGYPELTHGSLRLIERGSDLPDTVREAVVAATDTYQFFHWYIEFPAIFQRGQFDRTPVDGESVRLGGFDLVLGNPPFVNAIEGGMGEQLKRLVRVTHEHVGGTADLAYYFLSEALTLVRPGGRLALVQPRAALNATPLQALRAHLPAGLRPILLYAPGRSDFFAGPAVFIALVVLGPTGTCLVSRDKDPSTATWVAGAITTDNWWLAISQIATGQTDAHDQVGPSISDVFTVSASMTTGDAYDVAPLVVDEPEGSSPKLVTTGLIEPGFCLWGNSNCRYLKRDYRHPRISDSDALTASLRRRIDQSQRPKILVAGLTKRIECFVDRDGEYIGAVSTYSIFHPDDDVAELESLCDELLSDASTARFVSELGGNAMGGGNITMKKSFLVSFPYRTRVRG